MEFKLRLLVEEASESVRDVGGEEVVSGELEEDVS